MSSSDIAAGVPAPIASAISTYAERRAPVTMFVRALIANDLADTVAYMPKEMTVAELRASVRMVVNVVPGRARGSPANLESWLNGETKTPAWGNSP